MNRPEAWLALRVESGLGLYEGQCQGNIDLWRGVHWELVPGWPRPAPASQWGRGVLAPAWVVPGWPGPAPASQTGRG